MSNFRILYLEHDEERLFYKQAMETIDRVSVDLLPFPRVPDLEEKIKSNRYELVVTDANFLPEGESHDNHKLGEYLLSDIITTIREIDNRVKIAVFTNYSPGLLRDYYEDLQNVDYFWDKTSTPGEFLKWHISSIKRDVKREFPEYSLLDKVEKLLLNGDFEHPWKDHLLKMIGDYKSRKTEKDRLASIKKHFQALLKDTVVKREFDYLYDSIVDMELLNLAGKPNAWGHLRHVVNVFWLGFYFLNCGIVDRVKLRESLSFSDNIDIDLVWLITSLFHDIGYLGEIADNIIETCNEYSCIYPGKPLKFGPVGKDYSKLDPSAKIAVLTTKLPECNAPLLSELSEANYFDHGILSSFTVLSKFKKDNFKNLGIISAAAIAFHNLLPTKITSKYNKKYEFEKFPFGTLLILCDLIQSWERETGEENFLSKVPLEAVQLSRLDVDMEKRLVYMKINYLPFKYILPTENSMRTIETTIRSNILTHVIPNLEAINIGSANFQCKIEFVLDGRIDIEEVCIK